MLKPRYDTIDLLRGLIMILMALDHASAMIARVHFMEVWGIEFSGYPSLGWWFTRFVSHLCAPGFFFLMGLSIGLFAEKRKKEGWGTAKIRNYFLKRGSLILGIMIFLELPAWGLSMIFGDAGAGTMMPGAAQGGFAFPTTVLYGLGACMLITAFIFQWSKLVLLSISFAAFTLSGIYISGLDFSQSFSPFEHLLLVPGLSSDVMVIYPIIPWIGVVTFGIFWSRLLLEKQEQIYQYSLYTGLTFIAIFLGLRFLEVGNFQYGASVDWISFFTLIKYPPSLSFILFTCGANLVLFYLFSLLTTQKWLKPVKVFGQTAMFFYIAHLFLYALLGAPFPQGVSIFLLYLLWLTGLIILYFICRWYIQFKRSKAAGSIWKMI